MHKRICKKYITLKLHYNNTNLVSLHRVSCFYCYAECHYAECHYAYCLSTNALTKIKRYVFLKSVKWARVSKMNGVS